MLFPDLFEQSVARTPDRTAVVDLSTGEETTCADLRERATTVATALRARGVDPGDRVAVCMANRPEHVAVLRAAL